MNRKITRKPTSARRAAQRQGAARKVEAARLRTGSVLDRAMALVPLGEEGLHKLFLGAILVGAVGLMGLVAVLAGVPAMAEQHVAQIATHAGFEVRHVEVRGTHHLNELRVYERALAQRNRAMTEVDLAALRADLLDLSWVSDARVSRQLPDTLVVDIVERQPHAVLRQPDRLVLIDETGHLLEPVSPARAKGRLVLSGAGVEGQVQALSGLLDAAPALGPQVAEAQWVGNRRWNLLFKTGQMLALPEGDTEASAALVQFARMDGTNRLLGGKVVAFDMRSPDRIYLRVPGSGAAASEAARPAAGASAAASATATATASKGAN